MTNKPDFIVDSSGKVRDVRQAKYSSAPGSPPPNAGTPGPPGVAHIPIRTRKPKYTPYVILIPLGLILTLIIAILLLVNRSSKNAISESDWSAYQSGIRYYVEGEYTLALAHFNMAIHSNPELGEAYNSRGLVFLDDGKYDWAISDFNRAIELLADPAMAYSNRGITYYAMGEHGRAIDDLGIAIQLDVDFAKAYYNRGLVFLAIQGFDLAIADFDKAIEYTPESTSVLYSQLTQGSENEQLRSFTESLAETYALMQTVADLPMTYYSRGIAYLGLGDLDHAVTDFQKAIQLGLDPELAQAVEIYLPGP
jgi:tetratricopeptide (TPR) repeat protein